MLSARAALIEPDGKGVLPRPFNINKIRALATAKTDEARCECESWKNISG